METLPHNYRVTAKAGLQGAVALLTEEGAELACAAPVTFGGEPGGQSPEYLIAEAVAGCFILTFRAIAAASKLSWQSLDCEVVGTLDKVERKLRFSGFTVAAVLTITVPDDKEKALSLLTKAEQNCLISNSLSCPVHLQGRIEISP
ncbi:MAG: OsmC family protein [Porticoccaceae bacterium]|nr:OsmC family protein [Porticoccaceae bacterium]